MTVELRDYQQESVDALFAYFDRSGGNPLVELPTGAGKSIILAEMIRRAKEVYPPTRVMMLTHVRELVQQNYSALCKVWPEGHPPAGIYSAGLELREMGDPITYASVQSAVNVVEGFGPRDLIFVDEAHRIPKAGAGQYLRFLEKMREMAPHVKVVGLTATPFRLDGGYLHKGKDRLFTDIAHRVGVGRLVSAGWLSPVVPREPAGGQIDTDGVKVRGGEFVMTELSAAASGAHTKAAVGEMVRMGLEQDRKSWLTFACGIEHAEQIAEEVEALGVSVATIFGSTPKAERDEIVRSFRAQKIRCLVNCDVLTTGFDAPGVDLIALMRPTQSTSLYIQMVGRGLRIAPGKVNCLVLDYGGNVRRHGPIDDPKPASLGAGNGEAPVKECPNCGCLLGLADRECPDCDWVAAEKEPESRVAVHDAESDTTPLMTLTDKYGAPKPWPPSQYSVFKAFVDRHQKEGKPDSMVVTYLAGATTVREWVCFEHGGFASKKAREWWLENGGDPDAMPQTTDEALRAWRFLRKVVRVYTKMNGDFNVIVGRDFDDDEFAINDEWGGAYTTKGGDPDRGDDGQDSDDALFNHLPAIGDGIPF